MAADENILSWNVTNWITVAIIGLSMFSLAGFAITWWQKKQGA